MTEENDKPVKKATEKSDKPVKKVAPAKKTSTTKKAASTKKAAPAKKTSTAAASTTKKATAASTTKKAAPVKKTAVAPKKIVAAPKKAAPAPKVQEKVEAPAPAPASEKNDTAETVTPSTPIESVVKAAAPVVEPARKVAAAGTSLGLSYLEKGRDLFKEADRLKNEGLKMIAKGEKHLKKEFKKAATKVKKSKKK